MKGPNYCSMKKTVIFFVLSLFLMSVSCKKEANDRWNTEVKPTEAVRITDISSDFYNEKLPFQQFKDRYGFFLSPQVDDATYERKRASTLEKRIYKNALSLHPREKLEKDVGGLFSRLKHYFPAFQTPKVYIFSSATELYDEPILYLPQQQLLFVDLSAFMGEKSEFYEGIDLYRRREMNPENLLARIAETIAGDYVPATPDQQKFLDKMVNYGKLLILQDALLPQLQDHFKIGYSQDQLDWAQANEENIYNYFVENDLLFSDDVDLDERFLNKGPFSKFYTEIDRKSAPKAGAFIGWNLCRKYLEEHPEVSLQKFLQLPALEIFNNSNYKPRK